MEGGEKKKENVKEKKKKKRNRFHYVSTPPVLAFEGGSEEKGEKEGKHGISPPRREKETRKRGERRQGK